MADAKRPGITDEGVARLRARIGIPEPHPCPPHYRRPDVDAFRHVANAYGDDNPLFCDPAYGADTRWGGPIAPPLLVGGDTLIGEDEVPEVPSEHRELMRGDPLRGVHAFYSGSFHEWWHPLEPGLAVSRRNALVAVNDKQSEFAKRAIHEWTAPGVPATRTGACSLGGQYRLMVRSEREQARKRAGEKGRRQAAIELGHYDKERHRGDRRAQYRERAADAAPSLVISRTSNEGDAGRPDREGADDGHRHGVLARRASAWGSTASPRCASASRTGSASRASITRTSSGSRM